MAFISTTTSLYLADTRTQSKVVYLPAASTAQGRIITFKDYYGTSLLSTLRISTLGLDRIEFTSNSVDINQDFESIEILAAGNTNWSILGNYMGGVVTKQRSTTVFGIPNLNVWLDGADSTSMLFANETLRDVISWRDKSSNAYQFNPVNCNVRSRFSTNCITINQSTTHFISAVDIPGSQQQDFFCVVNENSLRGPMTGIHQNADFMWFETDGRYHTQFFADGNQTFTLVAASNRYARFFIFQGNLYYMTDTNPTNLYLYSNGGFGLISTPTTIAGGRGAAILDGRAYIIHANGLASMLPNGLISTTSFPASNFAGVCAYNGEIYANSFNSNVGGLAYPTFKYNPQTGLSSIVAATGQASARPFQYNGQLYSINDSGTGNFLQVLNGGNATSPAPFWSPVWNLNYTLTMSYVHFSNSLVYGAASQRLIEWRQDTGTLYLGSNSNWVYNNGRSITIPYRGRLTHFISHTGNGWANVGSFWTGKGRGASGGSDFAPITGQTLYGGMASAVYDGSLFIGTEAGDNNNIWRYGNGTTVDVNVSSITGGPKVVMIRRNQTNVALWVNGTELSNKSVTFTYSNNLAQPWYVGGATGSIQSFLADPGTDHMTGGLYEIMNFTSTLTTSDRQKVEGYLAWKYGVQANLPVSHPYFSSPPTS